MTATWDCVCGTTGVVVRYCPSCGRAAPTAWVPPAEEPAGWGAPPPPVLAAPPRGARPPENPYAPPTGPTPPYAAPRPAPYGGGWAPYPYARQRRDNTALVVVLVTIGAVLVGALALYGLGSAISHTSTERFDFPAEQRVPRVDGPVDGPPGRTEHGAAFDKEVRALRDFVSLDHGNTFADPVAIATVDRTEFRQLVLADQRAPGDQSTTLTILGLADRDDEGPTGPAVLRGRGWAYYLHGSDTIYLPTGTLTPYTKQALVHELTRAWQDQQYDLDELRALAPDDDALLAVNALLDADARRVARRWYESLDAAHRAAVDKDPRRPREPVWTQRRQRSTAALATLLDDLADPFLRRIQATGGNVGIDAAIQDPPRSTELLSEVDAYLTDGDPPVPVDEPPARGRLMDHGVLGRAVLAVLVAGDGKPPALPATAGWEGDAYVTYENGLFSACTVDVIRMDSTAARDRLLAALRGHPVGGGGFLRATGGRELSFRYCGRR